ncbi:MAG: PEGA domain-containing protein [Myxococcota bacterium]
MVAGLAVAALFAASPDVVVRVEPTTASAGTVDNLEARAVAGLEDAGRVSASGPAWPEACRTDACVREAMQSSSAASVVVLSVEQNDNVYRFSLEARSAATGVRLGLAEDVCEICGLEEVGELVALRAAALASRLEAPEVGTLRIETQPVGARVRVDGREVGLTPLEVELPEGAHAIEVEKRGFEARHERIEVRRGVEDDLRFDLLPTVANPARPWFIVGGVSVGIGAVLLGGGIPLILRDGDPYRTNCRTDIQGNCAKLYDTMAAGASLATAGAIGIVAGAVMVGIGSKRRSSGRYAISPTSNGVAVRF